MGHSINRFFPIVCVIVVLFSITLVPTTAQTCTAPNWSGSFYNSADFAGLPVTTSCNASISFNWSAGSPATGVGADNFSVRWTSTQAFLSAGSYIFTVVVEDGARLYINGSPVINSMQESNGPRTLTATYNVGAPGATAFITLEMNNYTGNAQISLSWALTGGTTASTPGAAGSSGGSAVIPTPAVPAIPLYATGGGQTWAVEYFNNTTFTAPPTATETSAATGISRDYANNSPAPNMPAENWSARWTRIVTFPAGNYTFYLRSDDSARVLIDNIEILNTGYTELGTKTAITSMSAGQHVITVEHTNGANAANLFLTWDPPVGTDLLPDGCNGQAAGVNGNAAPCPGLRAGDTLAQGTTSLTLTATVRAGPLRFRVSPSRSARSMQMLHQGEQYTALGRSADNIWVQLDVNGTTGWSMTEFLTLDGDLNGLAVTDGTSVVTPLLSSTPGAGVVVASTPVFTGVQARALGNMRLRTGPGINFDRVGGVDWGAIVNVIGRTADGRWLQVDADGVQGWSSSQWYEITTGDLSTVPVTN